MFPLKEIRTEKDFLVPVWDADCSGGTALVNPDGMTLCKNGEV
jgi:hypothetical protein